MADLKIRVFKSGASEPETTVTIPGNILKIASKLLPNQLAANLQDKGIDIDELIRLSENPEARGTLDEIDDHKNNEKVDIALE